MKPFSSSIRLAMVMVTVVVLLPNSVSGQRGGSKLSIYGYLQGSFYGQSFRQANLQDSQDFNTYTAQQLNVMMQKNLRKRWSVFINFAFTNTYSSSRNWGSLALEDAWVKYRKDRYVNVKMGLLIPRFNHLNEIRNKMPLLPYIIRPLVYETSFQEIVAIQDYVPQQAFVQFYGAASRRDFRFDYAVYLGNTGMVNSDPKAGQTGLDTSKKMLVGGRVGIEYSGLTAGFSATHDWTNAVNGLSPDSLTQSVRPLFDGTARVRLGGDISLDKWDIVVEAEAILVNYDDDVPEVSVDQSFWYVTAGYRFFERLFVYGSYWVTTQDFAKLTSDDGWEKLTWKLKIPAVGVSYNMTDKIAFKGTFARGIDPSNHPDVGVEDFDFYGLAISVMF